MDLALDRLRNYVVNTNEVDADNGAPLAYAIYVLARNGRPVSGDLRYLTDARLDAFDDAARPRAACGRCRPAGRQGARGKSLPRRRRGAEQRQALAIFARRFRLVPARRRGPAGARRRKAPPTRPCSPKAAQFVEGESASLQRRSTQEQSWMVLAAQATAAQAQSQKIVVDGAPVAGRLDAPGSMTRLACKAGDHRQPGDRPIRVGIDVSGRPTSPEPAEDARLSDRARPVPHGRLAGRPSSSDAERAAGGDAESGGDAKPPSRGWCWRTACPPGSRSTIPRCSTAARPRASPGSRPRSSRATPNTSDDRFVASFERSGAEKATFSVAYVVRAVSPGHYVQPPALIEDMYRPERFGRTGFGEVTIEAAKK